MLVRWQKKQGLRIIAAGLLMGGAVYATDLWKRSQLLAHVCALPIGERAPDWAQISSEHSGFTTAGLTGVALMCSAGLADTGRSLPQGIPSGIRVVCLYPDSLSIQAMNQWRGRQRKLWPAEWQRQSDLYTALAGARLRDALSERGEKRAQAVVAAQLPLDLISGGQTRAYRQSLAALLMGEFVRHCLGQQHSRWLLIYDVALHREIEDKFIKSTRIRYEEWGNQ